MSMLLYTDVFEAFDSVEETLVYVDAPLEGHARAKTGELFAFRCSSSIPQKLWHWVLVPVASTNVAVEEAFAAAARSTPECWIRVVEDRRAEPMRVAVVGLTGVPVSRFE